MGFMVPGFRGYKSNDKVITDDHAQGIGKLIHRGKSGAFNSLEVPFARVEPG